MKACLLFAIVVLVGGCISDGARGSRTETDAEVAPLDADVGEVGVETETEVSEPIEIEDDTLDDTGLEEIEEVEVAVEVVETEDVEVEVEAEEIEEVEETEDVEVEVEEIEDVVEVDDVEVSEEITEFVGVDEVELDVEPAIETIAEVVEVEVIEEVVEVIEDTVPVDTNPVTEATPEVSPEVEVIEEVETIADVDASEEVGPVCLGACALWTTTCSGGGGYKVCVPDDVTGCGEWGTFIGCQDGNTCSNGECVGTCTAPEILFVIDRSSSMVGAKWDMTRAEVLAFVDRYGPGTRIGLRTFPTEQTCAAGDVVPLATDNGDAVEAGLQAPGNASSSPLAAALEGLGAHFGEANQGERVVLVSDGSESCADVEVTIAAAVELRARGVVVDTIGVGMNYDTKLLTEIATAGGGVHRSATTRVALEEALAELAVAATGCERSTYGGYCSDGACVEGCGEGTHLCDDVCVSDTDVASCGDRCSPCPSSDHGTSACVEETCTLTCSVGYLLCDGGSACCRWNVTSRGKGKAFALVITDWRDVRYFQADLRLPNSTTRAVAMLERRTTGWWYEDLALTADVIGYGGALAADGAARLMYSVDGQTYFKTLVGAEEWVSDDENLFGSVDVCEHALAFDDDGTVHAVTRESAAVTDGVGYRSALAGQGWSGSLSFSQASEFMWDVRVAIGADQVCALWLRGQTPNFGSLQIRCRVNGTWSPVASPPVNWAHVLSAAFDASGNLHLLYQEVEDLVVRDRVRSPAGVWSTAAVVGPEVNGAILATDGLGQLRLVLSQRDVAVDQLYRWNGSVWAEGQRLPMIEGHDALLAFDPDNDPVVLYTRSSDEELQLMELVP